MSPVLPGLASRAGRFRGLVMAASCAALAAGCSSTTPKAPLEGASESREYFSEAEYGVRASPRVASLGATMPSGGGRYQLGRPYQIKGRWYRPKEDPNYVKVGAASWYGQAFHGRLTANGEVYDMMRLSAAHPTMPLPSYARVTNVGNGSSVLVRVNDRGPFARNRVIDLSRRAAELLDYKDDGVATVRVEYVGPAPLEGRDDQYLMASYNPGNVSPDPSDGLPSGVLIAMSGSTPQAALPGVSANAAFAGQPGLVKPPLATGSGFALPPVGPIARERPQPPAEVGGKQMAALSYIEPRVARAAGAFDHLLDDGVASADPAGRWNGGAAEAGDSYINAGSWRSRREAERQAQRLAALGTVTMEAGEDETGSAAFTVTLVADGRMSLDRMLQIAWASGAEDAFIVRQ